jgi:hypothetical protein
MTVCRDEKGRWLPGKSANPAGRPKESAEVAAYARTFSIEGVEKLVHLARHAKSEQTQLQATVALLDRGLGRPPVQTDETALDGGITVILKNFELPSNPQLPCKPGDECDIILPG